LSVSGIKIFQLKWNKNAVPGKPLKRKLPGTDEEEIREFNSIQPGRKFDDVQHLYGLLSG